MRYEVILNGGINLITKDKDTAIARVKELKKLDSSFEVELIEGRTQK